MEKKIHSEVAKPDWQDGFLIATDYPYFRDDVRNWADRLDKIVALGHRVIACYIPWRHHVIETGGIRRFDFHGETRPNRDVVGFLQLCQEKGLKVIAKPGPFIHAELNYGGLPNWVCPTFNPSIEPMVDAQGKPFCWGGIIPNNERTELEELPLPAPFDPLFFSEVEGWLRTVSKEVIQPFAEPAGPIGMIQVANEGIYSNYQRAPWAYDYSRSSLRLYARFLEETYQDLERYNQRHATEWNRWEEIEPPRVWKCAPHLQGNLGYADWAAYQSYYMQTILGYLREWVDVGLPFVLNTNPPTDEPFGVDAWLSRVNPDDLPGFRYGFTNWIGVACKDPSVVERYQVMIKRARGANHEENWGFSRLYEPEFEHPSVCFYQTMIQVASGATGYNIYTCVGTGHAEPELDALYYDGYPDCPPVDKQGQFTPKAEVVRQMNDFFARWGHEFLETKPLRPIAFGIYLPYAHHAVWVRENEWKPANGLGIPDHGQILLQFERLGLQNHLDSDLLNLQVTHSEALQRYPALVLASGHWMDSQTQAKLATYVQAGGQLTLVGEIPSLDESFRPLSLLAGISSQIRVISNTEFQRLTPIEWHTRIASLVTIKALNREAEQAKIWQYSHPEIPVDYLFVFSDVDVRDPLEFEFRSHGETHHLGITLPSRSTAIIRIEGGEVSSVLVKGTNEETRETILSRCSFDGINITAPTSGDWYYEKKSSNSPG